LLILRRDNTLQTYAHFSPDDVAVTWQVESKIRYDLLSTHAKLEWRSNGLRAPSVDRFSGMLSAKPSGDLFIG
jgi:hypothetical protein